MKSSLKAYLTLPLKSPAMPFWKTFFRSCRLKCPRCGEDRIFSGWFRMEERCNACGLKYERAPGYFLGSIYFNYGMTALLVVILYFTIYFGELMPTEYLFWSMIVFSILFPMWFFRYARSLWIGMDQYLDPLPTENEEEQPQPKLPTG